MPMIKIAIMGGNANAQSAVTQICREALQAKGICVATGPEVGEDRMTPEVVERAVAIMRQLGALIVVGNSGAVSTIGQADAVAAVMEEREYQDRKFGPLESRGHEVGAWLTIMRTLMLKAEDAWVGSSTDDKALDELRKVVATGFACIEQHGAVHRRQEEQK